MKISYIIALLGIVLMASCSKDDELFEGPPLNDLYGDFRVIDALEPSNANIDFANGETTYFTATFSATTAWELKITGLTSGAQKSIKGTSNELNAANATWNGSTTKFPMFKEEQCQVELYIPLDTTYLYDTISVVSTKVNEGLLLTDFENEIDPNWDIFTQSGADMSFNIVTDDAAPQGNAYYDMGGTVNWDWLIGMIEFPASAYGETTFALDENANNVYFNVLINVPEDISNALVLFQFREDENGDGTFNEGSEDMYSLQLEEDLEPGWQLISVKYSDLAALADGEPTTPNGNGVHNPDMLHKVSVLMLANPSSGYSQTLMDYLIFTEDAPLNP
ncbi:MAG: hypothetical protein R6U85_12785 [Salinivirgaceae bacterium]